MAREQSSEEMSSLASTILKLKPLDTNVKRGPTYVELRENYNGLLEDAKRLAGSVMSQDETPGEPVEELQGPLDMGDGQ